MNGSASGSPGRDAAGAPARVPRGPERRQLTVMFCDLVGSTALSQKLDVEDLHEVLRAFQDVCTPAIERYAGTVSRFMGDGILALFGYPSAHEDDAERALHAGLEIVAAVERLEATLDLETPVELRVRIGVATGMVVAGDIIGTGAAEEEAVVGETPNLAARLQGIAVPGTLVASDATHRLAGGAFEFEDLGVHDLKGFADPVRAWRAVAPRPTESRFEAAHEAELTPLVDRHAERDRLRRLFASTGAGESHAVLISGEAGIGKSRLVQALREEIAAEPHVWLRYQCSPHYVNTALYPFMTRLARGAGFVPRDGPADKLRKLRALLALAVTDVDEVLPLFAYLLSIPSPEADAAAALDAEWRKRKTFDALLGQVRGLAAEHPLIVVIEDVHWMDPTSGELIGRVAEGAEDARILLLITTRPGHAPAWLGRSRVSVLDLGGLSREDGRELVERVTGTRPLPESVLAEIVDKTDGIPLFVEEVTKSMLASGLLVEKGDRFELTGPLPARAIPETLHDSLAARLDQLGETRELARIGAVIGQEFPLGLLRAVAGLSEAELGSALGDLLRAGLVRLHGTAPDLTWAFRHALVRDVAYEGLMRKTRRTLHARVAAVLESGAAETGSAPPELLAYHHAEAGDPAKAVAYWLQAGRRASERSENAEASNHLRQGLAALPRLRDEATRERRELELLASLGPVQISIHGPGSTEVRDTYARALELCDRVPESEAHFMVLWGWWRINMNLEKARAWADRLLDSARRQDDAGLILQAHHAQWATLFNLGELAVCREHIDRGLAIYDPRDHAGHASRYGGHDPSVCGQGEAALTLWLMGYPDRARAHAARALEIARGLRHAGSLAHAMDFEATLCAYRRDFQAALGSANALIEFSAANGFPHYAARGRVVAAWASAGLGVRGEPVREARAGIAAQRNTGVEDDFAVYLDLCAEVCEIHGEAAEAGEMLDEAISLAQSGGMRHWLAELHRRRGAGLRARVDRHAAQSCFETALEIAARQQARALELRAAVSLAALRLESGDPSVARDRLAPVVAWFTEGLESVDLREARAVLETIEPGGR